LAIESCANEAVAAAEASAAAIMTFRIFIRVSKTT
jgi:hypothetical protein